MTKIKLKSFSDGEFRLSAEVNGKYISITYSARTSAEDAFADFKKEIEKARSGQGISEFAPILPSDGFAVGK